MKHDLIIIRYGEIALKSRYVREQFERKLINNITNALKTQNINSILRKDFGRIYLYCKIDEKVYCTLKKIFGIKSFSEVIKTKANLEFISKTAVKITNEKSAKKKSFAIRTTRSGKHSFTSQDVSVHVGRVVQDETGLLVNLTDPDFELYIEVRGDYAYLFTEKIEGQAGMPFGTQGKILSIIEDKKSILASWFLLRRGCNAIFAVTDSCMNDTLDRFKSDWFLPIKSCVLTCDNDDIYKSMNEISTSENCSCAVSGSVLSKKDDINKIKLLNERLSIPVITPLIAMDYREIKIECEKIGIKI